MCSSQHIDLNALLYSSQPRHAYFHDPSANAAHLKTCKRRLIAIPAQGYVTLLYQIRAHYLVAMPAQGHFTVIPQNIT